MLTSSDVDRLRDNVIDLQRRISRETANAAKARAAALRAQQAASRASSSTVATARMRDADRESKKANDADARRGRLEAQLAIKQRGLFDAEARRAQSQITASAPTMQQLDSDPLSGARHPRPYDVVAGSEIAIIAAEAESGSAEALSHGLQARGFRTPIWLPSQDGWATHEAHAAGEQPNGMIVLVGGNAGVLLSRSGGLLASLNGAWLPAPVLYIKLPGASGPAVDGLRSPEVKMMLWDGISITDRILEQVLRQLNLLGASHARHINRRLDPLPVDIAERVLSSAELLMSEAEQLLAWPPAGFAGELLDQLESDRHVVRLLLSAPEPDTLSVERALARIAKILRLVQPTTREIADEFEAVGFPPDAADQLASRIVEVGELVEQLGHPEEDEDLSKGRRLQAALEEIDKTLDTQGPLAAPATDEPDARQVIRDAKLRGRIKFWAEVWPEHKGRLVAGGVIASVSAAGFGAEQLGIAAAILRVGRAILSIFV